LRRLQNLTGKGSNSMETTLARLLRVAPELPASDLPQALAYYCNVLGFCLAVQQPGYAIVERDGVALHLFQDEAKNSSPVAIHVFSDDLDALYAELKASGASITQPIERKFWGNRDFRIQDAFGNILKFAEPLAVEELD
jgi:uncharacterized glyoxalase superfamily protein PhnB